MRKKFAARCGGSGAARSHPFAAIVMAAITGPIIALGAVIALGSAFGSF
jgi:hypothetical protein